MSSHKLLLLLFSDSSSDVSRPDRLSSAEIASIVQAAGLQGGFLHDILVA